MLLSALLGAVSVATAGGDLNVNIGGINRSPQQTNGPGSDQLHRIDKPQTGLGSISVPDTSRRSENPVGTGSLFPDPKSLVGSTTAPSSNSGTFPVGSTTFGQPTSNLFCSSSDVTIGENTQSKLHCSNTVGTIRH